MAVFALGETLADVGEGGAATVEAVGVVELQPSAKKPNARIQTKIERYMRTFSL
jgi:hypothetical protein